MLISVERSQTQLGASLRQLGVRSFPRNGPLVWAALGAQKPSVVIKKHKANQHSNASHILLLHPVPTPSPAFPFAMLAGPGAAKGTFISPEK